jgi:hypothetical protein
LEVFENSMGAIERRATSVDGRDTPRIVSFWLVRQLHPAIRLDSIALNRIELGGSTLPIAQSILRGARNNL